MATYKLAEGRREGVRFQGSGERSLRISDFGLGKSQRTEGSEKMLEVGGALRLRLEAESH
jgi:hypothetical protein